jgi:hypothetical protein
MNPLRLAFTTLLLGLAACSGNPLLSDRVQFLAGVGARDLDGTMHLPETVAASDRAALLIFWDPNDASQHAMLRQAGVEARDRADDFVFFGVVSGSDREVDEVALRALLQDLGVDFPQLRDRDGSLEDRFVAEEKPLVMVWGVQGDLRFRVEALPEVWDGISGRN